MDRRIVYPSAIPLDTDILAPQQNALIALGYLIQAVMGTATGVVGLACVPTSPASMTVNVGAGALWAYETIEATAFGSLPADTSALMKIGINKEGAGTNFTLTAPTGAGTTINYLLEAAFLEQDGTPTVLSYVNAANTSQPYSGPGNTGTAQNTARAETVQLQLKAGTPANTGTQTTPAVDSGWVPLYVITVNYGQSQIVAGNIAVHPQAPFINTPLPQQTPGFSNIAVFTTAGATVNGSAITWSNGGTWSPPRGTTKFKLRVWGAGGSGASSSSTLYPGGGGGAGGYGEGIYGFASGSGFAITVGAGAAGAAGGASSVGTLLTCAGGGLATAGTNSTVGGLGAGGAVAGADMAVMGAGGTTGIVYDATGNVEGGMGAGSFGSNPARGTGAYNAAFNGNPGNFPGGGASGGTGGVSAGANGLIIVEY